MNWEEQLIEDCRRSDGTLHPHTDHTLSGARWLLRKLRTNEAVTRLADFLHNDDVGETLNEHEKSCHIPDCEERNLYTEYAHAAINALVEEEP